MTDDSGERLIQFLVRAARELHDGDWVFTGFHWPLVVARLARNLRGETFTDVFEAGAACNASLKYLPTSTTDYPAYVDATCYEAQTADVLLALARRLDLVILDAGNVDLRGRINSTAIGPLKRPRVRLPGSGGAADIAAGARRLLLLHGGEDPRRIQLQVEHATSEPRPDCATMLITPVAVLSLGKGPRLREWLAYDQQWERHFRDLGVDVASAVISSPCTHEERTAAAEVLNEAATRGYLAAWRALERLNSGA